MDENDKETERSEALDDLLVKYSGHLPEMDALSNYDRASMAYFTDARVARHPPAAYHPLPAQRAFSDRARPGNTFTAYLSWGFLATIQKHPYLSWRHIDGRWYELVNLPLFIPVTSGLRGDWLVSVLLEDIMGAGWDSFSQRYNSAIKEAKEEARLSWSDPFTDQLHWSVYHVISNLPALQFTSLTLHESGFETAQPMFYFSHRHQVQDNLFVPFAVQFHHATFDPVLLTYFIADFQKRVG